MNTNTYKRGFLILTSAGLLFSGYLSGVKLISGTCAFSEPCPYFLGYPACWYGFALFLIMWLFALLCVFGKISTKVTAAVTLIVSITGILFAGRFTVPELMRLVSGAKNFYTFGLPTCVYGLIFYLIIFTISVNFFRARRTSLNS